MWMIAMRQVRCLQVAAKFLAISAEASAGVLAGSDDDEDLVDAALGDNSFGCMVRFEPACTCACCRNDAGG